MPSEKTTQKILFAWLIFLFVLTTRALLATKAGVLLVSLVIVAFSAWAAFRLLERIVAAAWTVSGVTAFRLIRKPAEAQIPDAEPLERK